MPVRRTIDEACSPSAKADAIQGWTRHRYTARAPTRIAAPTPSWSRTPRRNRALDMADRLSPREQLWRCADLGNAQGAQPVELVESIVQRPELRFVIRLRERFQIALLLEARHLALLRLAHAVRLAHE